MAKQAAVGGTVDLEPIDRLEEKVKLLVSLVAKLRADQARALEENARLNQELDALRVRLADAEATGSELSNLREERDVIRTRVSEMLQQLDGLTV
jgi:regulator of replication initiation timing